MPSYTVTSVAKQDREPIIQGKTFHCYRLTLAEYAGTNGQYPAVELLQIPTTPAPRPNEVIDGTIEPGKQKEDGSKWPDKLKRAKKEFSGGSFDPNRSARIERQHSQDMAIKYAGIAGYVKSYKDITLDQIREWTDWFEADIASKAPTEPPKTNRDPVPQIPLDRAKSILQQAQKAGLAEGMDLKPTLKAKLTEVGVESGLLGHLDVDQAEDVEAFIKEESNA